jgi:hypothetical protein
MERRREIKLVRPDHSRALMVILCTNVRFAPEAASRESNDIDLFLSLRSGHRHETAKTVRSSLAVIFSLPSVL